MQQEIAANKYKDKIITIPNILSLVRLLMIPLIVWLYLGKRDYFLTGIFLLISGLTDVVDGYIARHFNMISDVGKVLDPFADKATQGAMLLCLLTSFAIMWLPIILLILKESFMALSGYVVVKKCGIVLGADWHGKAATTVVASVMLLHLFWYDINPTISAVLIFASAAMILLSLILYAVRNFGYILGKRKG